MTSQIPKNLTCWKIEDVLQPVLHFDARKTNYSVTAKAVLVTINKVN